MRLLFLTLILLLFIGTISFFGYVAYREPPKPPASSTSLFSPETLPELIAPRVTFLDPVRGNPAAPITIVEYGDYLCRFCADMEPVLKEILVRYPEDVRLIWKDFPNEGSHRDATRSAAAARCVGEAGKYWEMHDLLLERADEFGLRSLEDWAASLGLERDVVKQCLESNRMQPIINTSLREALALKLTGAPSFFINDQPFNGRTIEEFINAINSLLP